MAITEEEAKLRRRLNLSYSDIRENNPNWSDGQIQDYLDKQEDINTLSEVSQTLQEQVDQNTATNESQQLEIDSNTAGVNNNAANIAQNAINLANLSLVVAQNSLDITAVTDNFNTHNASSSQHGVTGDNIGTEDYAQTLTGGAVLLAELVNDAVDSTVSVDSPDATDLTSVITLANETKADVNQVVTDLNAAIAQLNDLLAKSKTAKQMSTT